eukprot:CAMPEP_0115753868 /NCGR_PEP_ID=MMETSP0272-20121206/96559_1 /TAXON_ID=71861 /ORGANISM="Scrippsiella trochoidea, Strain CCMP3099" /LENGTH=57 /DNA_ID=CAMNT_0003199223 /DNA_START=113 /DNA_END=283 /DNA_ORIENTATION=+
MGIAKLAHGMQEFQPLKARLPWRPRSRCGAAMSSSEIAVHGEPLRVHRGLHEVSAPA